MVKSLLFGICQFLHDLDFHLFVRNRKSYLFHIPGGRAIIISYTRTKEDCKTEGKNIKRKMGSY